MGRSTSGQKTTSINGERHEVYSGLTPIGSTVKREGRWHAIAAGNRDVGNFDSEREARGALVARHNSAGVPN